MGYPTNAEDVRQASAASNGAGNHNVSGVNQGTTTGRKTVLDTVTANAKENGNGFDSVVKLSKSMRTLKTHMSTQDGGLKLLFQKAETLEATLEKARSPTVKTAIEQLLEVIYGLKECRDTVNRAFNATSSNVLLLEASVRNSPPTSKKRKNATSQTDNSALSAHTPPVTLPKDLTPTTSGDEEVLRRLDKQEDKLEAIMEYITIMRKDDKPNHNAISETREQWTKVRKKKPTKPGRGLQTNTVAAPISEANLEDPKDLGTKIEETKLKLPKGNRPRTRPDTVIVKAEGNSYADLLKKIKTDKNVQELGQNISAVNKTRDGHLRIVLNRKSRGIGNMHSAIAKAVGSEAICTVRMDTTRIEILDPDEETTDEEILSAIETKVGTPSEARILKKWKTTRGTLSACISVSSQLAAILLSSKLRIGYVNCRVRAVVEVKKCFRCQEYGHIRSECTGPERNNQCWKCGEDGHKSSDCAKPPKCWLCSDETSNDHPSGSFRCPAYRRAREATLNRYQEKGHIAAHCISVETAERKCFRCSSTDHVIKDCQGKVPQLPKNRETKEPTQETSKTPQ